MKRLRTWLRRLAWAVGVPALLAVLVYLTLGTTLARYIIVRALEKRGVTVTSLRVDSVHSNALRLSGVDLGPDAWLTARSVEVTYTLGALLDGRVREVVVRDGVWTERVVGDAAARTRPRSAALPGGSADLPFDRVELESCILRLALDRDTYDLRVDGALDLATDPNAVDMTVVLAPVTVAGERVERAVLELRGTDTGVGYKASAEGETWQAQVSDGELPGLARLLARETGWRTEWSWQLAGRVPPPWRAALRGLDLAGGNETRLGGTAVFEAGDPWRVGVTLSPADPLILVGRALTGTVHAAGVSFEASSLDALEGEVTVRADLAIPDAALRLTGAKATVPFTVRRAAGTPPRTAAIGSGRFSVERVRLGDRRFGGVSGTLTQTDDELTVRGAWRATDAAELDVAVTASIAEQPVRVEVLLQGPPFVVRDPAGLARLALGADAGDWRLGGTIGLDGRLTLVGDDLDARLEVRIVDGSLASAARGIEIGGLEAEIGVSGLAPPVTTRPQRLTFGHGRIGKLPLTNGHATLSLAKDGTLAVESLGWRMGEYGEFRAAPFVLAVKKPAFATEITASGMALGPWLALLTSDRVRAEGSVHGSLELRYDSTRSDRPITIGAGLLEAQPATGWVVIGDEKQLRALLEASDPRFRNRKFSDDVGDRIVAALQDFSFTTLRLRFLDDKQGTLVRIELAGRGRRGAEPLELGSLTLNVRGFDEYLYLAVMLQKELGP